MGEEQTRTSGNRSYRVTAVITTCRRSWEILERAIRSIEGQTYPVEELLLIDDNAKDSPFSERICQELVSHPLVRYISLGGNSGVGTARNKAIEVAKGNLLAYLDDDDEWFPEKIEEQVALFETHPGLGIAFGIGMKWNDDTEEDEGYTWSYTIFKEQPKFQDMLANDHIGSASHPLILLKALKDTGGFRPKDLMPAVEDYELWIRIVQKYPAFGLKKGLYRKHMNNQEHVSRNRTRTFMGYRYIYEEFKAYYLKDRYARKCILWNVTREGIKAKNIGVLPYFLQWLPLGCLEKLGMLKKK